MPQDDKYIVLHVYKFIVTHYHKSIVVFSHVAGPGRAPHRPWGLPRRPGGGTSRGVPGRYGAGSGSRADAAGRIEPNTPSHFVRQLS